MNDVVENNETITTQTNGKQRMNEGQSERGRNGAARNISVRAQSKTEKRETERK